MSIRINADLEPNIQAIVIGLYELAKYFNGEMDLVSPAAEPATQKRGRGRPVKGEETPTSTSVASVDVSKQTAPPASQPVVADVDPFDSKPAAPQPKVTLDDVRAALKALQAATDQATALSVLKNHGEANNLTELAPGKFYAVVQRAVACMPPIKTEPAAEVDPFEVQSTPVEAAKPVTLEDVKAAAVATGKHTSQDLVQKVVMKHGGKAPLQAGGEGPSLKALPESAYAACIKEIQALPKTK